MSRDPYSNEPEINDRTERIPLQERDDRTRDLRNDSQPVASSDDRQRPEIDDSVRAYYLRDRAYLLRESEFTTLVEIGTFRVINSNDLAQFLDDHTKDQFPNFLRCRSSSDRPPDSGEQPPVDSKTSPVPTDDGFRRDQDERMFPSRPDPPRNHPEELIEEAEARTRMSTLQRDELLTQSKILEEETLPSAKEAY